LSSRAQLDLQASKAQLDLQEVSFSGILSSGIETAKPEKFSAYREGLVQGRELSSIRGSARRRPERPPAGKIACHTKV
jgi:hypothetical protein